MARLRRAFLHTHRNRAAPESEDQNWLASAALVSDWVIYRVHLFAALHANFTLTPPLDWAPQLRSKNVANIFLAKSHLP
jgi:hypothetical protein